MCEPIHNNDALPKGTIAMFFRRQLESRSKRAYSPPSSRSKFANRFHPTFERLEDRCLLSLSTPSLELAGELVFTFSLREDTSFGGLNAANEDVIAYDGTDFSIFFDGSNVGLEEMKTAAMAVVDDDTILMTFTAPVVIPGIGRVDDSDVLMFTATSLGENTTAGSFSLYFDGSQFDLTGGDENIDALDLLDDGRLVISTRGPFSVTGVTGDNEDLIAFTPTSSGATIADGHWSLYFDGSDVGMTDENINAVTVGPDGVILLSTVGGLKLPDVSAQDEDVFSFDPSSLGSDTAGEFGPILFFDGAAHGLTDTDIYSIDVSLPNRSPVAEANGPYVGSVNRQVVFSSAGSTDPDGIIVSHDWDFGDGNRGTGPTTSHAYAVGGEYLVTLAVTDDQGGIGTATATVTINEHSPRSGHVLAFSLKEDGAVGGLSAVANEDVLTYDGTDFAVLFDGSDVGVEALNINAMAVIDDNTILMSFTAPAEIADIGRIDDSDIVMFTATSLGENTTAGSFSLYFDGSQFDLAGGDEDVDAFELLDDGRLVISTRGPFSVGDVTGGDEDLIAFTPTSPGATITDGFWSMYFDGSDVGLADDDVTAVAVGSEGEILLSTAGHFGVPGVEGLDEDVFSFAPSSLGSDTAGVFGPTLFLDGTNFGLTLNDVYAIDLLTNRNLGEVDFLELDGLDPSAGEVVYRFTTANDGYLTVDATFDPAAGSVELELLDATETPVGTLTTEDGYLRIDHSASTGGDAYTLQLSGTNTDVDLRLVNLVDHAGTTVRVHGTDAADTFSVAPTDSYEVVINGVAYHFDEADVDNVEFDGGGGDDVASFFDSTGDDTLTATPTEFRLTGTPVGGEAFTFVATNVAFAHAYAKSTGHDTADFTGSDGTDRLKIYPDYLKMMGAKFFNRAKFFESYTADGLGNTSDVALVYGSDAPDVIWAGKNELRVDYAAVLQPGERAPFANITHDVVASGFETVRAYADGDPNDWAEMHGSSANDVFIGKPHKVEMMNGPRKADGVLRGDEYKITARGFRNVVAVGDAGDVAKLYDSADPGIDVWAVDYRDGQTWSTMSTPNRLLYEVLAFGRVGGYGFNGGQGPDHGRNVKDHSATVDFVFQYGDWEE